MTILPQIVFALLFAMAVWLFTRKAGEILANIKLGKDENYSDRKPERWKNLLLLAFGQSKMFRKPLVAILHFIIYAGFLIINIEVLEIILDGLFGTHRLFAPYLGGFYGFVINFFELLAISIIVVCIIFLLRRNVVKIRRF